MKRAFLALFIACVLMPGMSFASSKESQILRRDPSGLPPSPPRWYQRLGEHFGGILLHMCMADAYRRQPLLPW